jgi:hypothetical protein
MNNVTDDYIRVSKANQTRELLKALLTACEDEEKRDFALEVFYLFVIHSGVPGLINMFIEDVVELGDDVKDIMSAALRIATENGYKDIVDILKQYEEQYKIIAL